MKTLIFVFLSMLILSGCTNDQFIQYQKNSVGCMKGDAHGSMTNSNVEGAYLRFPEGIDFTQVTPEQIKALFETLCP